MKRISILVFILCGCFGSVAWGQKPACPASVNWTEFHTIDMMRWNPCEKVLNVNNVGNLSLKWSYNKGGSGEYGFASSPAVVNGVVYVGGNDTNNVYALKASTGDLLWSYQTGSYVSSSPAVANGVVYVVSEYGDMYALKASDGTLLWSYYWPVSFGPSLANGVVYADWSSNDYGSVMALDARTGTVLWWDSLTFLDFVWSSPAVANGVVYFNATMGSFAVDASTGALLWGGAGGSNGSLGLNSSPAVANGVVYVGGEDNNVYALNAKTGKKLWNYTTGNQVWSSPAVANGVVYVGSTDNNVYALNAKTGAMLWSYTTNGAVESSPAVVNGVVYVGSDDGNVYAFGLK